MVQVPSAHCGVFAAALFGFVGMLSKYLFGTGLNSDIKEIRNHLKIAELQNLQLLHLHWVPLPFIHNLRAICVSQTLGKFPHAFNVL